MICWVLNQQPNKGKVEVIDCITSVTSHSLLPASSVIGESWWNVCLRLKVRFPSEQSPRPTLPLPITAPSWVRTTLPRKHCIWRVVVKFLPQTACYSYQWANPSSIPFSPDYIESQVHTIFPCSMAVLCSFEMFKSPWTILLCSDHYILIWTSYKSPWIGPIWLRIWDGSSLFIHQPQRYSVLPSSTSASGCLLRG